MRASIPGRLWMGAGAIAVFIGTLFAFLIALPTDPHDEGKVGLDFIAFYTAGSFVREGRSADLYDIDKVHQFQSALAAQNGVDLGSAVGPWWNPPFYAWVFVPIAKFPYRQALHIWVWINVACAALACAILTSFVARAKLVGTTSSDNETLSWQVWLLVPVLMMLSTPFIHALSHGQNTCTSLLLVTLAIVCWRKRYPIAAGAIAGLMFYKPQLGLVLAIILAASMGWRTLIGLSVVGTCLLLASLALPGALGDFLVRMPKNLHFVQCDVRYLWDRHVTFKAFWRLLLQGTKAGEPIPLVTILSGLCSAAVGAGLLGALLRVRKANLADAKNKATDFGLAGQCDIRRDRLIAACVAATPLLMPFYFDYDQLLLVIPAVMLASDIARRDWSQPLPATDLWLLRVWPVQYAWLMINPDISLRTHVNVGVVLLSAITTLLIARAWRTDVAGIKEVASTDSCYAKTRMAIAA